MHALSIVVILQLSCWILEPPVQVLVIFCLFLAFMDGSSPVWYTYLIIYFQFLNNIIYLHTFLYPHIVLHIFSNRYF